VDKKLAGFFNRSCVGSYLVVGDVGIATEFGNMKLGVINGPAQANFDASFAKQIPMNLFGRESDWLSALNSSTSSIHPALAISISIRRMAPALERFLPLWAIRESYNLP
jgi:hypothetical protein